MLSSYFFFNAPSTSQIYTLSLHDALPISFTGRSGCGFSASTHRIRVSIIPSDSHPDGVRKCGRVTGAGRQSGGTEDRKSTRLNSSHSSISYAVFCLKKKKKKHKKLTQKQH